MFNLFLCLLNGYLAFDNIKELKREPNVIYIIMFSAFACGATFCTVVRDIIQYFHG